jgi:N-acetyl sugar amidotransferase
MAIQEYQICNRCIMDTSDPFIAFDKKGYCNHCTKALETMKTTWLPNEVGAKYLSKIIERIKERGKGKDYDCIVGLSGGIDSSYLAYLAVKMGLRPLIVHTDCGWNSEVAVKNIENLVRLLNLELHTYVVDWEEMKDLQLAYLKASVANQDVPQDHAIFAALYKYAVKNNVEYVFTGSNFATESILPAAWGYNSLDYRNMKSIHKRYGTIKLKTFPHVTFFDRYIYYVYIKRMKVIKPLNYVKYNKDEAIKTLSEELGWSYYGGKHHESRFTKFFQTYYLPTKFGYDKRRAHLSSLIISGHIDRARAIEIMSTNPYSVDEFNESIEYVAKKLDLTLQELINLINLPKRSYKDFPSNEWFFKLGLSLRKL